MIQRMKQRYQQMKKVEGKVKWYGGYNGEVQHLSNKSCGSEKQRQRKWVNKI